MLATWPGDADRGGTRGHLNPRLTSAAEFRASISSPRPCVSTSSRSRNPLIKPRTRRTGACNQGRGWTVYITSRRIDSGACKHLLFPFTVVSQALQLRRRLFLRYVPSRPYIDAVPRYTPHVALLQQQHAASDSLRPCAAPAARSSSRSCVIVMTSSQCVLITSADYNRNPERTFRTWTPLPCPP